MANKKKRVFELFRLNEKQRHAVETIEGPVMVIAGPGTGKTQTLTARIAYILEKTDTPPDGILALTFTDAASREMRERLASAIGTPAYYVNISTFHAFCGEVIKTNPDYFTGLTSGNPLSDLERVSIFRDIIDRGRFSAVKPHGAPYFYVSTLMSAISDLKRESVSPNQLEELIGKSDANLLASLTLGRSGRIHSNDTNRLHSHNSHADSYHSHRSQQSNIQEEKYLKRNLELVQAYRMYQEQLSASGRYDFEDMINLVSQAFEKHPELLLTYQERFLYFLIDEYQDTNAAQNRLLFQLTSYWKNQANLFVVADDDQAIFRFQGASIENILAFYKRFPKASIITLTDNYRSTQLILDAALAVIQNNKLTLASKLPKVDKTLRAQTLQKSLKPQKIQTVRSSSEPTENFFVAKKIQELIAANVPPSEIAVLFRHNADGAGIAEMLARLGIPYDLEGGKNILTDPLIERLLLLMRAVRGVRIGQEGVDLFTLLNYPFIGADYLDVLKLSRFSADRKISLWEAIESINTDNTLHEGQKKSGVARARGAPRPGSPPWVAVGLASARTPEEKAVNLKNPGVLARVYHLLGELQQDDAVGPFVLFFEKLINKTGFLDWCLKAPDAVEKLNILNSFFAEVKRLNAMNHDLRLDAFLDLIDLMQSQRVTVTEKDLDIRSNSVALLTAHRAKGREFETVFILHAVDRKWGNNRVPELIKLPEGILKNTDVAKKEKNEDERRLFYVALTRAKRDIYLTTAASYQNGQVRRETIPSMFIHEIPEKFREDLDVTSYESGVKEILESLLTPIPSDAPSIDEQAFLRRVLENFKLSPTALNTYLACPYKFKLNNLLRAPRAKSATLSYGSAIHKALEYFFREFKRTRKLPNPTLLEDVLTRALKQEILTEIEEERLTDRGKHALSEYFSFYRDSMVIPLDVERFFGYGFSKTILGTVPLGGKIDKIEPIEGDVKRVRVIDYKTGQPKSRGIIEGKQTGEMSDYKRQLVFYRLLADLDERFQTEVAEAELDFVEPERGTGKLKKERFVITKEEVDALKGTIRRVWADILALKFPRTTDIQKHCPTCEWRFHCWPDGIPGKNGQLSLELQT